jgi:hypothetical protein
MIITTIVIIIILVTVIMIIRVVIIIIVITITITIMLMIIIDSEAPVRLLGSSKPGSGQETPAPHSSQNVKLSKLKVKLVGHFDGMVLGIST